EGLNKNMPQFFIGPEIIAKIRSNLAIIGTAVHCRAVGGGKCRMRHNPGIDRLLNTRRAHEDRYRLTPPDLRTFYASTVITPQRLAFIESCDCNANGRDPDWVDQQVEAGDRGGRNHPD